MQPASRFPPWPNTPSSAQQTGQVLVSVKQSRRFRTDSESIRSVLSLYNQCVIKFPASACQVESSFTSDCASQPVDLKFCVDVDYIVAVHSLGVISGTDSNDDFSGATLRTHLNSEATESRSALIILAVSAIVGL